MSKAKRPSLDILLFQRTLGRVDAYENCPLASIGLQKVRAWWERRPTTEISVKK
jgi:hypothetical protein